ncbi:hypothetical protein ACFW4X_31785 [Streptomyces smyrnaeus]|uniref:hypothetical protein n=1 Tax=Streptomyces smyrnaeus TaxID=1387713 RepID=UPI003685D86B
MRYKPLVIGALVGAGSLAMAVPASALSVSLSGAGKAQTWNSRTKAEITDTSLDGNAVAVQYYRKASPSKLRTIWVKTGVHTSNSSGSGSYIKKIRVREQQTGGDRYSGWKS